MVAAGYFAFDCVFYVIGTVTAVDVKPWTRGHCK